MIYFKVGLTCMAKLRDERFAFPRGLTSDTVACLDIIMTKQLSNGACQSILFKLILAILRPESSESLRRRYWHYTKKYSFSFTLLETGKIIWPLSVISESSQYALLLSYFQYCRHMLDADVPTTILQFLSVDEQDDGDLDLEKVSPPHSL